MLNLVLGVGVFSLLPTVKPTFSQFLSQGNANLIDKTKAGECTFTRGRGGGREARPLSRSCFNWVFDPIAP